MKAPAMSSADAPALLASIRALIEARALQYADKPFLITPPEDDAPEQAPGTDRATVLTFAQLRDDCRELQARFDAVGLKPGDTISVFMNNGIQTARLLLAAMYSGLICNPLNLLSQPSQLAYVVDHSDTRVIFVAQETETAIRNAIDTSPTHGKALENSQDYSQSSARSIQVVRTDPAAQALPAWPAAPLDSGAADGAASTALADILPRATDSALLMYTSGTTGAPKGVLLTHRNLIANARNISVEHKLDETDRVLASLPLYHINGLVVTLLAPLYHGGSVVMPARFSARTFWRDAAATGCTWINVVPTIVAYLINSDEACTADLGNLKFCRSASAALPGSHHRAFEARFGIGIIETMGMTETAAPAFSNPVDAAARRLGSIGLPSGCEAQVIGRDGQVCAPGETGELVLRGAQVMNGYYKRPEETRNAFTADGWLRTGDLGYRDAEGYFYINGRAKELIIKGGENIAPREIDEALLKHPGVLEVAAVGVPDDAYGQEIVAFVVPKAGSGCDALVDELRSHCLRELGRYKTPKEFRFVAELPRGPSGKIQRLKLLQT